MRKNLSKYGELIDLHTHLGASSPPDLLWRFAHMQGIRLPKKDYWDFMGELTVDSDDPDAYHKYHDLYDLTQKVQSSPYAVEHSVYEALALSYRKSGITIQEIRVNPMKRNSDGFYDLDRIIFHALLGAKRAMMEYPVVAGVIIEGDRRFTPEQNAVVLEKAAKFASEGVIGVDISGPGETEGFNVSDVVEGFKQCRQAGLGLTFHTGEDTGADEMWEVVESIGPDRIGHGIRSVDDTSLLRELSKRKTVLEVCPSSNLRLGIIKDFEEMKTIFDTIRGYDIPITINADAPVFLETNVAKEFDLLIENSVISPDDVDTITAHAKKASFIKKNVLY